MDALEHRDLALKLLASLHLSVAERRALPGGVLSFRVAVDAVGHVLARDGWFPFAVGTDMIGSGAVLEQRGTDVWVHEQHEIGVCRYSEVRSSRAASLESAVRRYIAAVGGPPIDGVQIIG